MNNRGIDSSFQTQIQKIPVVGYHSVITQMTSLNACRLIHLLNFKCFKSIQPITPRKAVFSLGLTFFFFTELINFSFIYGIKTMF